MDLDPSFGQAAGSQEMYRFLWVLEGDRHRLLQDHTQLLVFASGGKNHMYSGLAFVAGSSEAGYLVQQPDK